MQLNLIPHPATPPAETPFEVWARVEHASVLGTVASTNIWFGVSAPLSRFVIPPHSEPVRADELWQTTCFEAFLRRAGEESYREWNFAPSSQWAAYDFSGYRTDMSEAQTAAPYVRLEDNFTWWALGATFAADAGAEWDLGLSAVIEEKDGTKSYWALAHEEGDRPDFHSPVCFAARLP